MDNYTLWNKHGKPGVVMKDDEEEDDDSNILDWGHIHKVGAFENEPTDEAKENAAEEQTTRQTRSGVARCPMLTPKFC
jgi:hypothetical protein